MTIKEKDYCMDLLLEGLKSARQSALDYKKLENNDLTEIEKEIAELQGQNHLGYAQGIYQALSVLKYNHSMMKELEKLI